MMLQALCILIKKVQTLHLCANRQLHICQKSNAFDWLLKMIAIMIILCF